MQNSTLLRYNRIMNKNVNNFLYAAPPAKKATARNRKA